MENFLVLKVKITIISVIAKTAGNNGKNIFAMINKGINNIEGLEIMK